MNEDKSLKLENGEINNSHQIDNQKVDELLDAAVGTVADLDGVRVLEYLPEGIQITIYPPNGAGAMVSADSIFAELEAQGVKDYNSDLVIMATTEMDGKPVKIAEAVNLNPVAGQVTAWVSHDEMEASIRVVPPNHGGTPVNLEQCMAALANQGVVYGIIEANVQRALDLGNQSEEVTVAVGTPMDPGRNAELNYNFNFGGIKIQPKELEDGRADFYNLNLIQNVTNGQVLVTKTPLYEGTDGKAVTGKVIPTKPGKDVTIKAGKNTELIDNNTTLIAADNGHVVFTGGKISVLPVYEVQGDVDFSTGNVDFVGNVVIKGNVTEGFVVKSQGDVEVRGSIAGGSVYVEGHLQIKNGIQGVGKGTVKCGGNIFTKFIENARVKADGDIIVGEAIMHSYVYAKGNIQVGGRKGVIVGGVTGAGNEITAKIVGSSFSTNTELEAGVNPELREKYNETVKNLEEANKNLNKTQQAFNLLKHMENTLGELPTDKKAMLVKVSRAQFQLMALVQSLTEQVQAQEVEMESNKRGKINISNLAHPGVKITVAQAVFYVVDPLQFTSFVNDKGEIKLLPLK
ncbi:MAG: DUF342 domain-containing protein [Carboxydocellales bacterium]